jgi:hypothetical protein
MSGQVSFELWRRFYFPNIRDQLLAKVVPLDCLCVLNFYHAPPPQATLPLVKLCALVGMHGVKSSSSQSFSLTLHPLSVQPAVSPVL